MKWMKTDSKYTKAMSQLVNAVILAMWFLAGCLPIATIGSSIIAVHRVALDMTYYEDDYVSVTKTFWKAWRKNWKHGMILTALGAGLGYSSWMSFQLFEKLPSHPSLLLASGLLVVGVMLYNGLYVFLLEARYENTLRGSFRNARRIFVRYYKRTVGLIVVLFLEFAVFFMINGTLVFLGYLFCPVIMILTVSAFTTPVLRKIEKETGMMAEGENFC